MSVSSLRITLDSFYGFSATVAASLVGPALIVVTTFVLSLILPGLVIDTTLLTI
jgi:hypothetical protein